MSMDFMSNFFLLLSTRLIWTQKETFQWMLSFSEYFAIPEISNSSKWTWRKLAPHPKTWMLIVFFALSSGKGLDFIEALSNHDSVPDVKGGVMLLASGLFVLVVLLSFLHFCNMLFFVIAGFAEFRVQLFLDQLNKVGTSGHGVCKEHFLLSFI